MLCCCHAWMTQRLQKFCQCSLFCLCWGHVDRWAKQMTGAHIEIMIWQPDSAPHIQEHCWLPFCCYDTDMDRALVILRQVGAGIWAKHFTHVLHHTKGLCSKHPVWMFLSQVILCPENTIIYPKKYFPHSVQLRISVVLFDMFLKGTLVLQIFTTYFNTE